MSTAPTTVLATPVHPSWLTFLDKLLGIFQAVAPVVSVVAPQAAPAIALAEKVAPIAEALADDVAGLKL